MSLFYFYPSFAVNVQSGSSEYDRGNIYLHVSPVFSPPSRVVRNSLMNGSWGVEESTGWFPFQPNAPFEMTILLPKSVHSTSESFKIAINGTHYADFYPRPSHDSYSTPSLWLSADGDAQFSSIETFFVAPPPSPVPGYTSSTAAPMATPYPVNNVMPMPGMPVPTSYGRSPSPNPYPPSNAYTPSNPYPPSSGVPPPTSYSNQPYPTQTSQQDQGYYPTPAGGYYGPTPPGGHYPGHQPTSSNSMMSKIQSALPAALGGGAAAAALGSVLGHGKHKKMKKNKFLGGGHGVGHGPSVGGIGPGGLVAGAAGAALGAYALHKANPLRKMKKMKKGFKVGGGWSSSSSSSSD